MAECFMKNKGQEQIYPVKCLPREMCGCLSGDSLFNRDLTPFFLKGGTPATMEELKKRFNDYLSDLAKGKDVSKVRIILN